VTRRAALVAGASAFAAARRALADERLARRCATVRNYRGTPVSLRGGPSAAAGVLTGSLAGAIARPSDVAVAAAGSVATAMAAAAGWYDDTRAEQTVQAKGLRGHLGALRAGTVTTGAVKLAVLVAGGHASARVLGRGRVDALLSGALVAGTANLVNLLDLRPGRAGKVTVVVGSAVAALGGHGSGVAGAAAGAALGGLRPDLAEETMLGDTGANALGAALGVALAAGRFRVLRLAALGAVTALTVASERVSFSRVIDASPALRRADAWGRRAPVA
jgi:UDP-N-acetylmuramyl pentapeptide phosphotransferase/UDP-N-acetylglucosamine-1-phosphate transferase